MPSIEEALAEAREKPRDYYGVIPDLIDEGFAVVWGQHRDSDNLDKSNWDYVITFLNEKYPDSDDWRVEGSSHWAVGWCDQLLVRALACNCPVYDEQGLTNDPKPDFAWTTVALDNESTDKWWVCVNCGSEGTVTDIFEDMFELAERVKDYPLLDEEDYSRREHEDFCEWIEQELHYAWNQIDEDAEMPDRVTPEAVVSFMYDNYSVSRVDDVGDFEWVVDAVKAVANANAS